MKFKGTRVLVQVQDLSAGEVVARKNRMFRSMKDAAAALERDLGVRLSNAALKREVMFESETLRLVNLGGGR